MKPAAKIGFLPLSLVLTLLMVGCLKKKEFPIEPIIEFESFNIEGDSGVLMISFTDGDGDIGLREYDTISPYNLGSEYYYNLYLDYYEKQNGTWVKRDLNPPFAYRVPVITPSGQNKALEGTIEIDIVPIYYDPASVYDTIMYRVRLIDRALHVSNEVESDEIITP